MTSKQRGTQKALMEHFGVTANMIEPFKFVVESTTNIGSPLVFKITDETLIHGQTGASAGVFNSEDGKRQLNYPEVKGYEQLLEDYAYYSQNNFTQDIILDKNPDIIKIDWAKGIISC